MKHIKYVAALSALAWGIALPLGSHAQSTPSAPQAQSAPADSMTEGEIKKIDADAGKLTIKHGPIRNLDMPGMTMVFAVKDKSLLASVKPGDKVKFVVVREGGKMVVTELQAQR